MDDHVKLYHRAPPEHDMSTQGEHNVPTIAHSLRAQDEHTMSTMECKKEGEAIICAPKQISPEARRILEEIWSELEANREPTLAELADRFKVPAQTISKAISPFEIRAQETKRAGVAGRYFTMAMKDQIEEILARE